MCPRPRTAAAGACRAHGIGEKTGLLYRKNGVFRMKKLALCLTCLAMVLSVLAPLAARGAEAENKVVKVGWYESAFHRTDKFGRRSGYGYEFQQRVAIYTGWTFEYVEGSWSELFEMLEAGEIDLLSDVSYTDERAEKILYSAEEMGSEGYHVFIAPENTEISPDDFSTLNGKRVGVNKNSVQEQMFVEWAENHHIHPQVEEMTGKTPELLEMLANGEIDALVTLDTYGRKADVVPVCKVGFAKSYFGINKNRPDLKQELDVAMNRLLEDNRDFTRQLTDKYNAASTVTSFLNNDEKEWLSRHSTIRVGYRADYMPFCVYDEKTKALNGMLAEYLTFARDCEKNAELNFETYPFETTNEALKALADGEIDCVFPVNLSTYDGEKLGVIVTDPLVRTEMYAAMRIADQQGVSKDQEMTVALVSGNPNSETFLMDFFPNWKNAYYSDSEAGFKAVASGAADCVLVSNYRINRVNALCEKYKLTPLATDENMDISFAVKREDVCLYSILNKVNRLMPDETINSSLTTFALKDNRVTFHDFLRDNLVLVMGAALIVIIIILMLIQRSMIAETKSRERRQIISEAERDELTGLYNKNFFALYAGRTWHEHPDKPKDAIVLNVERLHTLNMLHGRAFGDEVLRTLSEEIQAFIQENDGIAGRIQSDHFNIYCAHVEDYPALLRRFQSRMNALSINTDIRLRMGVMPWQEGIQPVEMFDRAATACNMVRGNFKTHLMVYDDELRRRDEFNQTLQNDLARALEDHRLEVFYQPKYDIRSDTPKLASAEALVRWRHPTLGLISPGDFIPLFERSGQISALDNYVWKEAGRQIAAWREKYGLTLPVSVNLSRVDVFNPDLSDILDAIVNENGLDRKDMTLEVTESAYTENADQLIRIIGGLREKGYQIEMDDFGSGYSSLNMLSSMPIDVLKMDMAFIRNIERNERDFHLVELILDIARYLKVPVVAEGVETQNQLNLLKNAGCDLVQGYYFSEPLSAKVFEERILKPAL